MKTSELKGVALDWAVAKCMGHRVAENYGSYIRIYLPDPKQAGYTLSFCPSTDWAQGGPIIERECIGISCIHITGYTPDSWDAKHPQRIYSKGPTPLIAAMRCYVASKMGDEIEIPTELTKGESK